MWIGGQLMDNIRWIWGHTKQVRGLLLTAMVLMAVEALANLASIALQQRMIDEVILGDQRDQFWTILCQIAAAYVVYSLLFTFGPHVIHHTVAKLRIFMGAELMHYIHRIPVGCLQQQRTADYVFRLTHDLQVASHMAGSDAPRVIQQLASVIMIAVVMQYSSPYILSAMLAVTLLYIALGRKMGPARKQAAAEVSQARSAVLVHLEEGVSSTREIIAFHREDWELKLYHQKFQAYFQNVMKEGLLVNKQMLLSDPLRWSAVLFMLGYGGSLVLSGQLSVGLFVIVLQFSNRMMDAMNGLYQFFMDMSSKLSSIERIRDVCEGEQMDDGSRSLTEQIREIRFHNVSFGYSNQLVH